MNYIFFALTFCFTSALMAAEKTVDLTTSRGSRIQLDIYNLGMKKALVMAPGQGCNPRLDMYEAIGKQAKNHGYTLVRLYWAYCVADPQNGQPSDDLSAEKEDFMTTLKYARENLKFLESQLFVGGKSLGSIVASDVFQNEKSLQGLVLLTPVCTDRSDAKNPKSAFKENYPSLSEESRPVLMAQGNEDLLCETQHFQDFFKGKGLNFIPLVVRGNHSLGVTNAKGEFDAEAGAKNLAVVSNWIFTWLGL